MRSGQCRAPSVPTPVRDLSTTRASGTPGERGGELVSEQALLPRTRRAPDSTNSPRESCCLPASPRLSPPRHTFPLAPAAALTSGPPCAHPCPRSPTAPLPSTLRLPAAPSRPLAHSHPRPGSAFPAPPPARPLRRAGPGCWRPGATAPGRDPLLPAGRGAEAPGGARSARGAGGARRGAQWRGAGRGGGARSLTLGCAHARTNSHTDTRGVRCRRPPLLLLPPPP